MKSFTYFVSVQKGGKKINFPICILIFDHKYAQFYYRLDACEYGILFKYKK